MSSPPRHEQQPQQQVQQQQQEQPEPSDKPPLHPSYSVSSEQHDAIYKPPLYPTSSASAGNNNSTVTPSGVPGLSSDVLSPRTKGRSTIYNHDKQNHHRRESSLESYEDLIFRTDQAERGLLQSVEQRRSNLPTAGGDMWHASYDGERPPLGGNVPLESMYSSTLMMPSLEERRNSGVGNSNNSEAGSRGSRGSRGSSTGSGGKLADIARRMRQRAAHSMGEASNANTSDSAVSSLATSHAIHRRGASRAHAILDSILEQPDPEITLGSHIADHQDGGGGGIFERVGNSGDANHHHGSDQPAFVVENTFTDQLLSGAMQVEDLFDDTSSKEVLSSATSINTIQEESSDANIQVETVTQEEEDAGGGATGVERNSPGDPETLPLKHNMGGASSYASDSNYPASKTSIQSENQGSGSVCDSSAGGTSKSYASSNNKLSPNSRAVLTRRVSTKNIKLKQKWSLFTFYTCRPHLLIRRIFDFLWFKTTIITVCIPCVVTAWILYYWLYNPTWAFLPGHASVAWWFNFIARQFVLLEFARVLQWLFIDKVVLGTRIAVKFLGPLLTLIVIQARGWPFCVAAWGILDLILLEGTTEFQRHWLFFTTYSIYSKANSGSYILSSETYIRLLISLVLTGIATAGKRTAVAMYFGRRTFVEFKPRLEKLLKDVVLVSELAALAEEAALVAAEELTGEDLAGPLYQFPPPKGGGRGNKVKFFAGDVSWNSSSFKKMKKTRSTGSSQHYHRRQESTQSAQSLHSIQSVEVEDDASDVSDNSEDEDASGITTQNDSRADVSLRNQLDMQISEKRQREYARNNKYRKLRVKDLLEHWEEPVNKLDKSINTSISDILRFRRALTFMDDDQPFGETFGPASTRDQLIASAQNVYSRLLKMTPGRSKMSCDFYDMLALHDDGETVNYKKLKALRRLFRPDANNELSLLAFVQCCDKLYKKLRYFRANVGNASVIDHALESIVDAGFNFILTLLILTLLRFNPWPLLVSISTLLVSVSFAVGASASKWVEGMLLVAVRRPFDLGDRIYMHEPSVLISDGLWYSWFIEDINLFHTTIRYAGTNEVATLNNGAIANMRIVNGARSPNAAVWFQFPYRPTLMENGNFEKMRAAMETFARDNPRDWHSFSYMRVDEFHPELEKLVVTIGFNHRSAWQDLVAVLEAKAKLMCWTFEYGRTLGVNYDVMPQRDLVYYAGALKDGAVRDHRCTLHDHPNVSNAGFPMGPPTIPGLRNAASEIQLPEPLSMSANATFLANLKTSQRSVATASS